MEFKDILLLVNVTATDDVYPTLIQHAREHGWRLTIEDRMAPPAGWRGDGALVQAMDWPVIARYVRSLMRHGIPVVNLTNSRISKSIPSCVTDYRKASILAAKHFLSRGFRHAAFFTMEWLYARGIGAQTFARAMKGCDMQTWAWPLEANRSEVNNRKSMARWLRGKLGDAPKPLAALCPNAYNAVTLLNVCLDMGISVPDEVAIMTTHYDPAFCDCQAVPITGVEFDTRRQAREAAKLLDRMISRKTRGMTRINIPPARIVVQQSTDVLATENPLLRDAFRYIRENLSRPFGAAEIAEALGVPRVRLDRTFAAELKRSAGAEILRQRLARAKRMLAETDDTLAAVASSCGFCHASYFVNAFKRNFGTTPRRYRLAAVRMANVEHGGNQRRTPFFDVAKGRIVTGP